MNGSGIVRGGGYHYHATGFRCGRRMARANESSLGGIYIGFRLNGVYRGGSSSTSLASNTNRSGHRRTREKNVSGMSAVGFRI